MWESARWSASAAAPRSTTSRTPEGRRTLLEIELTEGYPQLDSAKNDDEAEYLVPVRWIYTVSRLKQAWRIDV